MQDILQQTTSQQRELADSETEMTDQLGSQIEEPPETSSPLNHTFATPASSRKRQSTNIDPSQRSKILKKLPINKPKQTRFESAVNKLHAIAELSHQDIEDQYEKFGKHIASQMRELPLKSFIILQSKFQNLITEERLASIQANDSIPVSERILVDDFGDTILTDSTPDNELEYLYSETSNSTSFDQEEPTRGLDVLSQALVGLCPVDANSQ